MIASIEDYKLFKLVVRSNPFFESLTLTLNSTYDEEVTVSIYDINGRKVYEETRLIFEGRNDLDIENLESPIAGTYLLSLRGRTIYLNERLLKTQ